jgi:hypothetical protein
MRLASRKAAREGLAQPAEETAAQLPRPLRRTASIARRLHRPYGALGGFASESIARYVVAVRT